MTAIYKNLPSEIQEVIDTKILVLNTKENMKSVLGELVGRNIYNELKWYYGRREQNNYLKFICFDAIPYYIKEEGKNKEIDMILSIIDIIKEFDEEDEEITIDNNLNLIMTGFIDIIDYYIVDMMDTNDFIKSKNNYNNLYDKLGIRSFITNDIDIDINNWVVVLKGKRRTIKNVFKLFVGLF